MSNAWSQVPLRPTFTYSPSRATKIDRFYLTQDLLGRKTGIEILPAAFTDHDAVVLRLSINNAGMRHRRGRWKMDSIMVTEPAVQEKIRIEWARWQRSRPYYADELM
jgi:hypothetical protein